MQIYLLASLIWLLLSACSDDSIFQGFSENTSRASIIEQASLDLDKGHYDKVVSDLSIHYNTTGPDPDIGQRLASAYMGLSWVDLTRFIEQSENPDIIFDVVSSMVSSPLITVATDPAQTAGALFIDGDYTATLLDNISKAKRTLSFMDQNSLASPDDIIQLGYASAVHFIFYIGSKTADALNKTLDSDGSEDPTYVPLPLDTMAYIYYRTSSVTDRKYRWDWVDVSDFEDTTNTDGIYPYQEDLICIRDAISASAELYPQENAPSESLDMFLRSVLGASPETELTDDIIMAFTSTELFNYVQRLANTY